MPSIESIQSSPRRARPFKKIWCPSWRTSLTAVRMVHSLSTVHDGVVGLLADAPVKLRLIVAHRVGQLLLLFNLEDPVLLLLHNYQ